MTVIYKPDNASLKQALAEAESLRERGKDYAHIAHSLLYLSQLNEKLEAVAVAAKEYVHFGEDSQLHLCLLKAIEQLDDYQSEAEKGENTDFGLD
jgi:hypothetical protein